MKRIILHWTAGTHAVSSLDKQHYHRIIDGNGQVYNGTHAIEDNESTRDGDYAAHTLGCNTGSIGIAVCCCAGATESPLHFGPHPPTHKQLNELVYVTAVLCQRYGIPVTKTTVLTHGEVEPHLHITQRGKWDLNHLPGVQGAGGDWIRAQVKQCLATL